MARNDGKVLYLYVNGKRATSIARTWGDIAQLLRRPTCDPDHAPEVGNMGGPVNVQ